MSDEVTPSAATARSPVERQKRASSPRRAVASGLLDRLSSRVCDDARLGRDPKAAFVRGVDDVAEESAHSDRARVRPQEDAELATWALGPATGVGANGLLARYPPAPVKTAFWGPPSPPPKSSTTTAFFARVPSATFWSRSERRLKSPASTQGTRTSAAAYSRRA